MGNMLIVTGILIVIIGIIMTALSRFGLPMLPGDIFIQKGNFSFYFPIVTSIVISIVLTVILNLFK